MNVLYVDDNPINRLIGERTLRDKYAVTAVETAEEVFALLEKHDYDMYVIDLNLNNPEIDGFGVLSHIKNIKGNDAVFIACTNYLGDDWEKRCLAAGFDYYLVKPLRLATLAQYEKKRKVLRQI